MNLDYFTYKGRKKKPAPELVFTKKGSLDQRCMVNRGWEQHNVINDYYARVFLERVENPTPWGSLRRSVRGGIISSRYS